MAVYKPQIKTANGVVDLPIEAERALKDGNGDTIATTYVKTVNGKTPTNGNVDTLAYTLDVNETTFALRTGIFMNGSYNSAYTEYRCIDITNNVKYKKISFIQSFGTGVPVLHFLNSSGTVISTSGAGVTGYNEYDIPSGTQTIWVNIFGLHDAGLAKNVYIICSD